MANNPEYFLERSHSQLKLSIIWISVIPS